ncbi:keratinocyte proline-rich protein-like, partial [Plakobranchus ocellatus]
MNASHQYPAPVMGSMSASHEYPTSAMGTMSASNEYLATAMGTMNASHQHPAPAMGTMSASHQYPAPAMGTMSASHQYPAPVIGTMSASHQHPAPAMGTMNASHQHPAPAMGTMSASHHYPAPAMGLTSASHEYPAPAMGTMIASHQCAAPAVGTMGASQQYPATTMGTLSASHHYPQPILESNIGPSQYPPPMLGSYSGPPQYPQPVMDSLSGPPHYPQPIIESISGPSQYPQPIIDSMSGPPQYFQPIIESISGPPQYPQPIMDSTSGPLQYPQPIIESISGPPQYPQPIIESISGPPQYPQPIIESNSGPPQYPQPIMYSTSGQPQYLQPIMHSTSGPPQYPQPIMDSMSGPHQYPQPTMKSVSSSPQHPASENSRGNAPSSNIIIHSVPANTPPEYVLGTILSHAYSADISGTPSALPALSVNEAGHTIPNVIHQAQFPTLNFIPWQQPNIVHYGVSPQQDPGNALPLPSSPGHCEAAIRTSDSLVAIQKGKPSQGDEISSNLIAGAEFEGNEMSDGTHTSKTAQSGLPDVTGQGQRANLIPPIEDRRPTNPSTRDYTPVSSRISPRVKNDLKPESSPTKDRRPTNPPTRDYTPVSSRISPRVKNDRKPESSPTKDRKPESSPTKDRKPGSSPTKDRRPVSFPTKDRKSESSPTKDRKPESSPTKDRKPGSSPTKGRTRVSSQDSPRVTNDPKPESSITTDKKLASSSSKDRTSNNTLTEGLSALSSPIKTLTSMWSSTINRTSARSPPKMRTHIISRPNDWHRHRSLPHGSDQFLYSNDDFPPLLGQESSETKMNALTESNVDQIYEKNAAHVKHSQSSLYATEKDALSLRDCPSIADPKTKDREFSTNVSEIKDTKSCDSTTEQMANVNFPLKYDNNSKFDIQFGDFNRESVAEIRSGPSNHKNDKRTEVNKRKRQEHEGDNITYEDDSGLQTMPKERAIKEDVKAAPKSSWNETSLTGRELGPVKTLSQQEDAETKCPQDVIQRHIEHINQDSKQNAETSAPTKRSTSGRIPVGQGAFAKSYRTNPLGSSKNTNYNLLGRQDQNDSSRQSGSYFAQRERIARPRLTMDGPYTNLLTVDTPSICVGNDGCGLCVNFYIDSDEVFTFPSFYSAAGYVGQNNPYDKYGQLSPENVRALSFSSDDDFQSSDESLDQFPLPVPKIQHETSLRDLASEKTIPSRYETDGNQAGLWTNDQAGDQADDEKDDQIYDEADDQASHKASDGADDQASNQAGDQTEDQTNDQTGDQVGVESDDQTGDQAEDQTGDQAGVEADDQADDQAEDQTGDQAGVLAEDQTGDQADTLAVPDTKTSHSSGDLDRLRQFLAGHGIASATGTQDGAMYGGEAGDVEEYLFRV